ncbi:MAG: hypothetical protein HOB18_08195 [Nitrospina sp.]|nr:hypothetical protein [Nitrospina sp.]MBT6717600.1 hypothetical protein [Nitrospina sp.]
MIKDKGTYSFCQKCPSSGNCCSRVKRNGSVDAPVVFDSDMEALSLNSDDYSEVKHYGNYKARAIHTNGDGCYFFQGGKCTVYDRRPIDCRLFPLDIIEKEGRLIWIAYKNLCPVEFNPEDYLEDAKSLLSELGDNVFLYANLILPGMDKEPYIELEEVELQPSLPDH